MKTYKYTKIIKILPQEILNIEEIKNYLRISHDYDDKMLENFLLAAVNSAEKFTAICLFPKILESVFSPEYTKILHLRSKSVQEIISVKIFDQKEEKDLDKDQYYFSQYDFSLILKKHINKSKQVKITYKTETPVQEIPCEVKCGLLLHISEMYDRKEQMNPGMSIEVKSLYMPYRDLRI